MCMPSVPDVKTPEITPPPPPVQKDDETALSPQDAQGQDRVKRARGTKSLRVDPNVPTGQQGASSLTVPV